MIFRVYVNLPEGKSQYVGVVKSYFLMFKAPFLLVESSFCWFPSLPPCKTVPAPHSSTATRWDIPALPLPTWPRRHGASGWDMVMDQWTKTLVLYPKVAWLIEDNWRVFPSNIEIYWNHIFWLLTLDPSAYSKPQKPIVSNKQRKSGQYPSQSGNMSHS